MRTLVLLRLRLSLSADLHAFSIPARVDRDNFAGPLDGLFAVLAVIIDAVDCSFGRFLHAFGCERGQWVGGN